MKTTLIGLVLAAENPTASAAFFAEHFGFTVNVDLGWYVNTQQQGHPALSLDFVQRDHESWPAVGRGSAVAGSMVALVVDDADAEFERLEAAGVRILLPLVTEPWGQRRFQLAGPDGVVVEILHRVAPDPSWLAANGLA